MKHEFSFSEVNFGFVSIESDSIPTRGEIIDAIESGKATYKHTEYEHIRSCGSQPQKSKPVTHVSR